MLAKRLAKEETDAAVGKVEELQSSYQRQLDRAQVGDRQAPRYRPHRTAPHCICVALHRCSTAGKLRHLPSALPPPAHRGDSDSSALAHPGRNVTPASPPSLPRLQAVLGESQLACNESRRELAHERQLRSIVSERQAEAIERVVRTAPPAALYGSVRPSAAWYSLVQPSAAWCSSVRPSLAQRGCALAGYGYGTGRYRV